MARKYTKVEELTEAIRARKSRGETNREIGASYGLSKRQVAQLINRQNRKERKIAAGCILRPKGRPRTHGLFVSSLVYFFFFGAGRSCSIASKSLVRNSLLST